MLAPLEILLPAPTEGIFNEDQWTTFISLLDTVIPSITDTSDSTSEKDDGKLRVSDTAYAESVRAMRHLLPPTTDPSRIVSYLSESATSIPKFRQSVHRFLPSCTPADQLKGLRLILSCLNTRAGCLALTGSTTSFHLQSPAAREQIFLAWSRSYLSTLRALTRSLTFLAKRTWVQTSPTLPEMIGFPATPKHGERGQDYPYQFLNFSSSDLSQTIETDVLIVGSGCGAGVCAKNLAEAGYKVVVAEKSQYFSSAHFPMKVDDGSFQLMESSGALASDDASVVILAGSTFGGGGTVNWSASLQTQAYVRQEWADQGLPFFTSAEFQKCLDRVCGRIGASTSGIEHNFANRTLLEGSRRLGYTAKDVPQNTGGKEHYCGYCTMGCASGTKAGPAVCFFPAAAEAGAQFVQGFDVRKIEFDHVGGTKRVLGATGVWTDKDTQQTYQVRVKARKVIVCAGTLNSPLLLMRSGLKNRNIGQNLHLHPVTIVGARFDEVTNPWEGGILTSVNTSLENLDNKGHGCKIECMTMLPGLFLPMIPWSLPGTTTPALDYRTRVSAFHHHTGFVVIARDRDTGSVYPDPSDGRVRVAYTPSAFDANHLVEGSIASAKIAYANGAREIFTMDGNIPPFVRLSTARTSDKDDKTTKDEVSRHDDEDREEGGGGGRGGEEKEEDQGINNPAFQSYLQKLRRAGLTCPDPNAVGCAHQMGTCRMSSSSATGVVDPHGRVWGFEKPVPPVADEVLEAQPRKHTAARGGGGGGGGGESTGGLYVADASVFPSASGVNPMVTVLAIGDWISRCVIRDDGRMGRGRA